MKKNSKPELTQTWWNSNKPKAWVDNRLEVALADYVKGLALLEREKNQEAFEAASELLDQVEKHAEASEKVARDKPKKEPKDYDAEDFNYTVEVLKKFGSYVKLERKKLEDLVEDEEQAENEEVDQGMLLDEAAYKKYLKKMMKRMQSKAYVFAFALSKPSTPEEHRFLFHKSKEGKILGKQIVDEVPGLEMKKLSWGMASADPQVSTTLVLMLEHKQLPGMVKQGNKFLKAFKPLPFDTIKLVSVETGEALQDLPDPEDTATDTPTTATGTATEPSTTAHGEVGGELSLAYEKKLAELAPRVKKASDEGSPDSPKHQRLLDFAVAKAEKPDFQSAVAALLKLEQLLDNAAPKAQGADQPLQPASPSAEQRAYEQKQPGINDALNRAVQAQHPESTRMRDLMAYAVDKVAKVKDYTAALKALGGLEKLLAMATKKPVPQGAYAAMKAKAQPRLDTVSNRTGRTVEVLAYKITAGVKAADALSAGNDDGAAIASLRALITEVEDILAVERDNLEERLQSLLDKATDIRLDLKGAMDPFTVQTTVSKLLQGWDFDTAKVMLDRFEKAIEQAKPIDFEGLEVVEQRRAQAFRKENARAARNTEQARMAARRLIDDDGFLQLGEALLDDPALANPAQGSKEEGLKQRVQTQQLLRDLPFIRVDDLAAVAEELAASKEASLPQSVHALQMLQRLQGDKRVQAALASVTAPPDPSTVADPEQKQALQMAQTLIRNSLDLPPDAVLTDADAKRAAVAALLTQVRQGSVGSCFATASAIRVQRNKPEVFLADMAQMLSTGKLTRTIESPPGTPMQIEVPISREMVGRKVDVKRTDAKLHLRPNMIASLDVLGVDEADQESVIADAARQLRAERALKKALDKVAAFLPATHTVDSVTAAALQDLRDNPAKTVEAALKAALSVPKLSTASTTRSNARKKIAADCCKDFDDPNGTDDFTPQELLAKIASTRPGPLPEGKLAAAQAAFDNSQDNTLTRAWEYTVSSMAEKVPEAAQRVDQMSAGIGAGAAKACEAIANKTIASKGLTSGDADTDKAVASNVATSLAVRLKKELKVLYDPEVQSRSGATSADGSSNKGGWAMFFRGKKIDGQEAFENMVKTLAEDCKQDFGPGTANNWEAKYVNRANEVADNLKAQAETKAFRDGVIDGLAAASGLAKDKFNLPWTMEVSGWEYAVMQLYENQKTKPPAVMVKAYKYKDVSGTEKSVQDAEGLTHFVVDTLSKLVGRLPDGDAAQSANVPVANSPHAFALTPGSSSLQTLLKQGKTPAAVVAELKEVEGAKNAKRREMPVSLNKLGEGLPAELIAKATELFGDQSSAVTALINAHFQSQGKESMPLAEFAAELKKAVRKVFDTDYSNLTVAERESYTKSAMDLATGAILERVVPKEEYEPLIDAAMRKLAVPDDSREPVSKAVLAGLKSDALARGDLAQAIRTEMRKLGLGGGNDDLKLAREAYDALKTDEARVAALKAAGRTVASPAASFDKLDKDDAAALREHGVSKRLDERLDKSLVEPRGLVFADTNWGDGDHMTHLSMVVNPLSDPPVIEMYTMKEDGSGPALLDDWIKDSDWRVYADPETYGGTLDAHQTTTADGRTVLWETYRAELQAKFNDCVAAKKGDIGKLRGILEIADARFADADFAAADKALAKFAEVLAPDAPMASKLAKGLRPLESVSDAVRKQLDALKADAKEKKLKTPSAEQKEASAAFEVLGSLIYKLRNGVETPQDLATFVAENRDALDYIDTQSPLGNLNLVTALTT